MIMPTPCLIITFVFTQVPAKWWAEYSTKYLNAHPCAGCDVTPSCPHIPTHPGAVVLRADGTRVAIVTSVVSNFVSLDYPDPVRDFSLRCFDISILFSFSFVCIAFFFFLLSVGVNISPM